MSVFLIQVSGGESTNKETKSTKWWQEPIEEHIYINHDWKRKRGGKYWNYINEGDKIVVYCTGNVPTFPNQISHIFTVKKVEINNDNAMMVLGNKIELPNKISLGTIRKKIKEGIFSEKMKNCGNTGYKIGPIKLTDFNTILELSHAITILDDR